MAYDRELAFVYRNPTKLVFEENSVNGIVNDELVLDPKSSGYVVNTNGHKKSVYSGWTTMSSSKNHELIGFTGYII